MNRRRSRHTLAPFSYIRSFRLTALPLAPLSLLVLATLIIGWPPLSLIDGSSSLVLGQAKESSQSSTHAARRSTGFEQETAGAVSQFANALGHWKSTSGKLTIENRFANSGKQCLHLSGKQATLELDVADGIHRNDELTFVAERWTSQPPFLFRIEKLSRQDGWRSLTATNKFVSADHSCRK